MQEEEAGEVACHRIDRSDGAAGGELGGERGGISNEIGAGRVSSAMKFRIYQILSGWVLEVHTPSMYSEHGTHQVKCYLFETKQDAVNAKKRFKKRFKK